MISNIIIYRHLFNIIQYNQYIPYIFFEALSSCNSKYFLLDSGDCNDESNIFIYSYYYILS